MLTDSATLARVLVVDDDKAVARQLGLGLEALGFSVVVTHSMAEALEALGKSPETCVVVTDIRMPGGSGLELAEAVSHQRGEAEATEVIIITGHATLDDATTALRCGAADFLPKPFRLTEARDAVQRAVDRALKRRKDARAASESQLALSRFDDERQMLQAKIQDAEQRFHNLSTAESRPLADLERARLAVSHALRTPLNLIASGTALISDDRSAQAQAESLELLRNGVNDAVVAVELVEELNRLQVDEPVAMNAFDVAAYVDGLAASFTHEHGTVLTCTSPPAAVSMIVMASPLRIRRAITLCFDAAAEWGGAKSQFRYETRLEHDGEGRCFVSFTVIVSPLGQDVAPPAGSTFEETTSFLSRTQESLRFFIARRLVAHCGGTVTSWTGTPGSAAIRLAIPLLNGT